jgi:hypothetical protein
VQRHHVVDLQAGGRGGVGQVGPAVALVADGQAPVLHRGCQRAVGAVQQRLHRRLQHGAAGGQRVVEHRQRPEGGHGLDHARQRTGGHGVGDGGVQRAHGVQGGRRDGRAKFHGESHVAGIEPAGGIWVAHSRKNGTSGRPGPGPGACLQQLHTLEAHGNSV